MLIIAICSLVSFAKQDPFHHEVSKVLTENASTAYHRDGLVVSGQGGMLMHNVSALSQIFKSSEHVNIIRARQIFVKTALDFITRTNEDRKLRPYLNSYPFSIENIRLIISFTENKRFIEPPYIANVSCYENRLFYSIINSDQEMEMLEVIHEETFEEACRLVDEEKKKE
ncbi:MAG: hypothetical protein H7A40_05605 [Chlamydiales bacterium]|nr:hypothetical protein [Chlamydiales bacterium]